MAGVLKKTTKLTGMAVAQTPHKTLNVLYEKTLKLLKKMPENAAYRKSAAAITEERLGIVKSEPNIEKLELKLNAGQIEEVILQADRELSLARKFLDWRPWEPLVEQAPATQWKWPIK